MLANQTIYAYEFNSYWMFWDLSNRQKKHFPYAIYMLPKSVVKPIVENITSLQQKEKSWDQTVLTKTTSSFP